MIIGYRTTGRSNVYLKRGSSITLGKLLMLAMLISLIYVSYVRADMASWDSEAKMVGGTMNSIQINRNPGSECDANRVISTGYDYPGADTNPAGICNRCNGTGGIANVPNGQDSFEDCPGSVGTCAGSSCNGAGNCQYLGAGKQGCGTCKYCSGSSYSCSNVANGLDTYGECPGSVGDCAGSYCNGAGNCQYKPYGQQNCGACKYCSGSSYSCRNVPTGQDTFNNCPGSLGECAGQNCDYGECEYLSGKQSCGLCQYCIGYNLYTCYNIAYNTDPYNECDVSTCGVGTCGGGACRHYAWVVDTFMGGQYLLNETVSGTTKTCSPSVASGNHWAYATGHLIQGERSCTTSYYNGITFGGPGEVTKMTCELLPQ